MTAQQRRERNMAHRKFLEQQITQVSQIAGAHVASPAVFASKRQAGQPAATKVKQCPSSRGVAT